jgi:predicted small metal-binding protein
MATGERKVLDCRKVGTPSGCTLAISGTEQEVMSTAVLHAVNAHGLTDSPGLREELRRHMESAEQPKAA